MYVSLCAFVYMVGCIRSEDNDKLQTELAIQDLYLRKVENHFIEYRLLIRLTSHNICGFHMLLDDDFIT